MPEITRLEQQAFIEATSAAPSVMAVTVIVMCIFAAVVVISAVLRRRARARAADLALRVETRQATRRAELA
jgi:hypothetical protein